MRPSRFPVALAALCALAGAARADPPPAPPPPSSHAVLAPGQELRLSDGSRRIVPPTGALYLEREAYAYLVERQRFADLGREVCLRVADEAPSPRLRVALAFGIVGAVVGATAAVFFTR